MSVPDLNLAIVGNCRLGAALDRAARIVWCCFPNFDGDPIFCSLLAGSAGDSYGYWAIDLENCSDTQQSYSGNTPIVETTLTNPSGERVRITDFAPRFRHYGRSFRPPMLVRKVEPLSGTPRVTIRLRPAAGYGAMQPSTMLGSNHIGYVAGDMSFRLTTTAPISYITTETPFVITEAQYFILSPNEPLGASISGTAEDFLHSTEEYWTDWVRFLSIPFEWQDAVIRAAITLKLCEFEETGAILAALTTSIPEAPNSTRNWDYRYCWLRDSFFVVRALNRLGATKTMEEYIGYITTVAALEPDKTLRPVYSIVPSKTLSERTIPSLAGYRDMGPVRVGNQAAEQIQHDSYGNVILAATQMFFDKRLPHLGDHHLFTRLEVIGEKAREKALLPDAGIWEFRGSSRVRAFSAMMCWAGIDRLAAIAEHLGLQDRRDYWRHQADTLRDTIMQRAVCPRRHCFTESFDSEDLDASLLLAHEIGFIAPRDPLFLNTLTEIEKELRHGDLLFRYVIEDDFGKPEVAFTVCTFWYIDALAAVGRVEEARAIFCDLLERRNHVGLLSEDIAPQSGELWGNFPQTYSMVGLINSALRLSRSWESAFAYPIDS